MTAAVPGLFPEPEHTAPAPEESGTPGERRRARQLAAIALGQHPLSVTLRAPLPLHPAARRDGDRAEDGSPRCGSCDHRERMAGGNRSYPKCLAGAYVTSRAMYSGESLSDPWVRADGRVPFTEYPRATHGTGSDVASWWPGCIDYYRAGSAGLSDPRSTV